MNISLNHKHVLGIFGIAVLIAAVAFLLPKAFVHGDVPPSEVNDLSLSVDGTSITATWGEPSEKGDGTYITYSFDFNNLDTSEKIADTTNKTTYTFSNLAEGRYTFSVSAQNDFGISMPVSGEATVSLAPQTPTGFTYSSASAETDLIDISWSAPDVAVESYRIYVVSPDRISTEYTVAGDTYTWMSPSLLPDGVYNVSLVAENNSGLSKSLPTETLRITLGGSSGGGGGGGPEIAKVGPQNLSYDTRKASANNLSISWDADLTGLVTDYKVQVTQGKTALVEEVLASNITSYSVDLDSGVYNITVFANYSDTLSASSSLADVVLSNSGGGKDEPTEIVISKVKATLPEDPTAANITWLTDVASDSLVEYGPGKIFADAKVADTKNTTSHEIRLANLFMCTVYNYRVSSSDGGENSSTSDIGYFITNGCVKDSSVTNYSIKDIEISKQDTITLIDTVTSLQKGILNVINPVASDVLSVVFELKQLAVTNTTDFEKADRKLVNKEIFDIKAYKEVDAQVKTFDQPVQVTLNFIPSELPKGVSTDSLAIWHSSDDGETWEKLDNCSVEVSKEDTGIVVCDTYGFSLFAIFSDEKVSEEEKTDTSESSTKSRSTVSGSSKKVAANDIVSVKANGPVTFTFTHDLYYGLRSSEIKTLQQTLNSLGFLVSTYGAGSVGNETNYYGEKTKQAVARFQEAHLSEILTPYGFTRGTGRVGPYTRALLNTLLSK